MWVVQTRSGKTIRFPPERTPSPLLKSFQRVWFVQTLCCIWVLGG
jgi:hypothetical protein